MSLFRVLGECCDELYDRWERLLLEIRSLLGVFV